MPAINGHTNGASPHLNGASRSPTPITPATDKPAIEAAIDKLDAFKVTFHEALIGVTEITTLLKQAMRDQKTGEKKSNPSTRRCALSRSSSSERQQQGPGAAMSPAFVVSEIHL